MNLKRLGVPALLLFLILLCIPATAFAQEKAAPQYGY